MLGKKRDMALVELVTMIWYMGDRDLLELNLTNRIFMRAMLLYKVINANSSDKALRFLGESSDVGV